MSLKGQLRPNVAPGASGSSSLIAASTERAGSMVKSHSWLTSVDDWADHRADIRAEFRRRSRQFVEQRFCLLEVRCFEAFGEPAIDGCEQVADFSMAALAAAEPGEARGGTQFPEL